MKGDLCDRFGKASQQPHAEMMSLSRHSGVSLFGNFSLNRGECNLLHLLELIYGGLRSSPHPGPLLNTGSKHKRCSPGMALLPAPVKTEGYQMESGRAYCISGGYSEGRLGSVPSY